MPATTLGAGGGARPARKAAASTTPTRMANKPKAIPTMKPSGSSGPGQKTSLSAPRNQSGKAEKVPGPPGQSGVKPKANERMCACGKHTVRTDVFPEAPKIDLAWVLNPKKTEYTKNDIGFDNMKYADDWKKFEQAFAQVADQMFKEQKAQQAAGKGKNPASNGQRDNGKTVSRGPQQSVKMAERPAGKGPQSAKNNSSSNSTNTNTNTNSSNNNSRSPQPSQLRSGNSPGGMSKAGSMGKK